MLLDLINELNLFLQKSEFYLKPWSEVIGIIWCIDILNWVAGSPLNIFGIYPRRSFGLLGIVISPFLHSDFSHLFLNTIPLFVLGLALLANGGAITFYWVTLVVAVVGGLGVWLFARKGLHIGASGVISGYFGYILMNAYTQPNLVTVLLAILAIYYFGGIFSGIFPGQKHISWEAHFFGFASGILCAYLPNELLYFLPHV